MALRYQVSFAPVRRMGRIAYLSAGPGAIPEPPVKVEEGIAVLGGGGLLIAGLSTKGKGGTAMTILGALAALVGVGLVAKRAMTPITPVAPPVAVVVPPAAPKSNPLAQYLPAVQQYLPQFVNLFAPKPAPPQTAPLNIVTSYSSPSPAPAPDYSGIITSI